MRETDSAYLCVRLVAIYHKPSAMKWLKTCILVILAANGSVRTSARAEEPDWNRRAVAATVLIKANGEQLTGVCIHPSGLFVSPAIRQANDQVRISVEMNTPRERELVAAVVMDHANICLLRPIGAERETFPFIPLAKKSPYDEPTQANCFGFSSSKTGQKLPTPTPMTITSTPVFIPKQPPSIEFEILSGETTAPLVGPLVDGTGHMIGFLHHNRVSTLFDLPDRFKSPTIVCAFGTILDPNKSIPLEVEVCTLDGANIPSAVVHICLIAVGHRDRRFVLPSHNGRTFSTVAAPIPAVTEQNPLWIIGRAYYDYGSVFGLFQDKAISANNENITFSQIHSIDKKDNKIVLHDGRTITGPINGLTEGRVDFGESETSLNLTSANAFSFLQYTPADARAFYIIVLTQDGKVLKELEGEFPLPHAGVSEPTRPPFPAQAEPAFNISPLFAEARFLRGWISGYIANQQFYLNDQSLNLSDVSLVDLAGRVVHLKNGEALDGSVNRFPDPELYLSGNMRLRVPMRHVRAMQVKHAVTGGIRISVVESPPKFFRGAGDLSFKEAGREKSDPNSFSFFPAQPLSPNAPLMDQAVREKEALIMPFRLAPDDIFKPMLWNSDYKSFFALSRYGVIRKISFPELVEELRIDLHSQDAEMALSSAGLLVLLPTEALTCILNPNTLEIVKSISTRELKHITASAASDLAFGTTRNKLIIINARNGTKLREYTGPMFNQAQRKTALHSPSHTFDQVQVTQDMQYLFATENRSIIQFQLAEGGLLYRQSCDNWNLLSLSDDSAYVIANRPGVGAIFARENLSEPALQFSGKFDCIGLDKPAARIYGLHELKLSVFDTGGSLIKQYDLSAARRKNSVDQLGTQSTSPTALKQLLVYPGGNNALIFHPQASLWIQLPNQSN